VSPIVRHLSVAAPPAGGYPLVAGVSTTQSSTTDALMTVTLPTGIQNGDLVVMAVAAANANATVELPSGWTNIVFDASGADLRMFYRVCDGSEGASLSLDPLGGFTTRHVAIGYRITNYAASNFAYGGLSLNVITSPAVSPGLGSQKWLGLSYVMARTSAWDAQMPAGYSDELESKNAPTTSTSSVGMESARVTFEAASSTAAAWSWLDQGSTAGLKAVTVLVRGA
jgi:hypothetical protein